MKENIKKNLLFTYLGISEPNDSCSEIPRKYR